MTFEYTKNTTFNAI